MIFTVDMVSKVNKVRRNRGCLIKIAPIKVILEDRCYFFKKFSDTITPGCNWQDNAKNMAFINPYL